MENSRISRRRGLLQPRPKIAAGETEAGIEAEIEARERVVSMGATQTNAGPHIRAEAEQFLRLGLIYSTGETVPADMVTAHKWFNIAGMRGSREAIRHRCEIAREMSSDQIAAAQREARVWLTRH